MTSPARGLICVSVAADTGESLLAATASVLPLIDVVEIRLDAMRDPCVEHCIAALGKPVLITNRPLWEGGQWSGSEEERIELLCQGLRWGARYADIELKAAPALHAKVQETAHQHNARVIVSSHDFHGTPDAGQLHATLARMMACGADIGKIVTTATSPAEALRVLALQEAAMANGFPLSAFAMGQAGTISRLATLYLGGCMTYAALSRDQATAPGQLTVHDLRALLALLEQHP